MIVTISRLPTIDGVLTIDFLTQEFTAKLMENLFGFARLSTFNYYH